MIAFDELQWRPRSPALRSPPWAMIRSTWCARHLQYRGYETPNNVIEADEAGRVHFVTFPSRRNARVVARELDNLNFTISNNGKTLTFPYASAPTNAQNRILDALSGTRYSINNNNSNYVWDHNGNGHDVLWIYRV